MRLLLVEDDIDAASFIARGLMDANHDVRFARDGRDALFLIGDERFDAIILDRRLPLIDGLSVLKRIRNEGAVVPVVMLTALGSLDDKVEGLDAGADDYLVKPVEIAELNARLSALVRRPAMVETGVLRTATIELNVTQHKVRRGERPVKLRPLEFKVLAELLRHVDQVVTRQMLLKNVWGYDFEPTTNIVAATVVRMRATLNGSDERDAIRTVHGMGYTIASET